MVVHSNELPRETGGVAAGYVADQVCRDCHVSHFESYQHVGMSQSFKRPENARRIESFGEIFFHEPSQRYYQMLSIDNGMLFRRFQQDEAGNILNDIEIPVDWVLGSGNRTRSYLYQTDYGEIFQLPIGWYSQGGFWEMSPGFEQAGHNGVSRKVARQCMFCHNAFPEVESDAYGDEVRFPQVLPEGTGCQRCHGPGGNHIEMALTGSDLTAIRQAIVNPGKLNRERRDSVCMQCHLQPSVSIVSPVRFDRGEFSFRPGELLSDFVTHLDVRESGIDEPDRFEINHHGYRLMKSECYVEGGLTCIDCHNPHVKPGSKEFRQQVAGVCLDCHEDVEHASPIAGAGCVDCHMPTRRTQDVVHVLMTDHWIAKGPFDTEALVAPIDSARRAVSNIRPLEFGHAPSRLDAQAYIAVAAMRANRSVEDAVASLIQVLNQKEYEDYVPYLDLTRAWLKLGDFRRAESFAGGLIRGDEKLVVAYDILGLAQLAQGKLDQAKLTFKKSLALQSKPETHLALASVYFENNEMALSEIELDTAIQKRPLMAEAFRMKGRIALSRHDAKASSAHFKRSLKIDPGHRETYRLMADALTMAGDKLAADRYLNLAKRLAPRS